MNYRLFELVNDHAGRFDAVDDVMEFVATWVIYLIFAVVAVLVAVALYHRRARQVIELGVALFFAFAAATVVSHVSGEQRPFQNHPAHQLVAHEPGVALPSDHATAAFALAFGVYAFLSRAWGITLGVAAVAVGFSRIWVGVHYPGDIAAAVIIAGVAVSGVVVWNRRRTTRLREGVA
ncbi:phosphatase PAP2 family protein [Actinoplanes sp. NPDC051494]|uniref:phosphatase PAP2 family protein n=1 Tax=Actinoplanes sp. NPDC051494 TaxID=3363907 RepID=UPI0037A13DA5